MENPYHKIDETFRQRLRDAEVPPPPFVWPAVEQALQKRRRRKAFWLFAFGLFAAGSGLWISDVSSPAENPTSANSLSRPEISALESPAITAQTQVAALKPETAAPAKNIEQAEPHPGKLSPKGIATAKPKIAALGIRKPAPNDEAFVSNTEIPPQHPLASETAAVSEDKKTALELLSFRHTLQTLTAGHSAAKLAFKQHKNVFHHKKNRPRLCYDFSRYPSAWLLDLYAGPSLAQRSLTSRLDDRPYLNQRLSTERRGMAWNAGARLSLMFNRNFLVRSGLHYEQVTEVFEHIDPTSTIYDVKVYVSSNGQVINDTVGVQYGKNYLKAYNRYSFLDVPLMLGMEMRRGRSGISINAGATVNLLFHKRGAIIDPATGEPAKFGAGVLSEQVSPLGQEVFRASAGLSAVASIQWYWHLSERLRLFAEPSFRQVLRPVSLGSHPVEHRYSIIGLKLGATKIF